MPFKTGFARIALECGVRVLPVAICDSHRAISGFSAGCARMALTVGWAKYKKYK